MTARDREAALFQRCILVARARLDDATDGREANVFRVAAMVLQSSFPAEALLLKAAADRYFAHRPHELAPVVNVIHNGDVISLPRLRDGLSRLLRLSVNG